MKTSLPIRLAALTFSVLLSLAMLEGIDHLATQAHSAELVVARVTHTPTL